MNGFFEIFIPAVVILLLGFAAMAIKMLVRKNSSFPNTHIHGNKYLQENDIHCVQKEDSVEQFKAREKDKFRNLKYLKKQS